MCLQPMKQQLDIMQEFHLRKEAKDINSRFGFNVWQ